ncbi:hypothetical protein SFUMM280S_09603 [Streptomyces fumanus]
MGDPDAVRPAGLDARLHGGAGVVDVHMNVPQPVAADHDEGVPEGVQPGPETRHGGVLGLQQVDHLEGGPAVAGRAVPWYGGLHARVRHASGARRGLGASPARQRLHQRPQHRDQAVPPGVDHPGVSQRRKLCGRRGEGRAGALVGGPGHRRAVAPGALGGVGRGRGDGQHGAFDRVGHGLPGGVGRPAQRQPEQRASGTAPPVTVTVTVTVAAPALTLALALPLAPALGGKDLRHTPQQLRQDRPGVAPGPDQRPVRHRPRRLRERGTRRSTTAPLPHLVRREHRLHRRRRGLDGQVQVRPGVPVGDRIDVDRVDLLAGAAQRPQGQTAPGAHRRRVDTPLRHLRHLRLLELGNVAGSVDPAGAGRRKRPGASPGAAMVVSLYGSSRCMLLRLPDPIGPIPLAPPLRSRPLRKSDEILIPACRDPP